MSEFDSVVSITGQCNTEPKEFARRYVPENIDGAESSIQRSFAGLNSTDPSLTLAVRMVAVAP